MVLFGVLLILGLFGILYSMISEPEGEEEIRNKLSKFRKHYKMLILLSLITYGLAIILPYTINLFWAILFAMNGLILITVLCICVTIAFVELTYAIVRWINKRKVQ